MHWITPEMYLMPLPVLEKVLRTVLVYFALVVLLRLFGKRELAQLNPFDLVVLLTLSNTVQNAIIGNDNSVSGGLIGALTLLAVNYTVVRFVLQHRRLDQILSGEPTMLVHGGKVVRRNLARELLSESELRVVAHRQGFELSEVQECTLEPGGSFSMRAKTPKDDKKNWQEVMKRLDAINDQLKELGKK